MPKTEEASLQEWLEHEARCFDVEPVTLTIGRTTYEACRYKQHFDPLPGARNQEPWVKEVMYVLGELPAAYVRSSRTCFRMPGDVRDWYVAGSASAETASSEEYGRFHYGDGASFLLSPWEVPDGSSIDDGEARAYRRTYRRIFVETA